MTGTTLGNCMTTCMCYSNYSNKDKILFSALF